MKTVVMYSVVRVTDITTTNTPECGVDDTDLITRSTPSRYRNWCCNSNAK